MCLHVSHDCNLRCRYCFAGQGVYGGVPKVMSAEVARAAIDFLVEKSVGRRNLELDFFGGEPLMNWKVVKETVAYARSLEKKHGKCFRFTTTTNGVLLNPEINEYLNREMHLSLIHISPKPPAPAPPAGWNVVSGRWRS